MDRMETRKGRTRNMDEIDKELLAAAFCSADDLLGMQLEQKEEVYKTILESRKTEIEDRERKKMENEDLQKAVKESNDTLVNETNMTTYVKQVDAVNVELEEDDDMSLFLPRNTKAVINKKSAKRKLTTPENAAEMLAQKRMRDETESEGNDEEYEERNGDIVEGEDGKDKDCDVEATNEKNSGATSFKVGNLSEDLFENLHLVEESVSSIENSEEESSQDNESNERKGSTFAVQDDDLSMSANNMKTEVVKKKEQEVFEVRNTAEIQNTLSEHMLKNTPTHLMEVASGNSEDLFQLVQIEIPQKNTFENCLALLNQWENDSYQKRVQDMAALGPQPEGPWLKMTMQPYGVFTEDTLGLRYFDSLEDGCELKEKFRGAWFPNGPHPWMGPCPNWPKAKGGLLVTPQEQLSSDSDSEPEIIVSRNEKSDVILHHQYLDGNAKNYSKVVQAEDAYDSLVDKGDKISKTQAVSMNASVNEDVTLAGQPDQTKKSLLSNVKTCFKDFAKRVHVSTMNSDADVYEIDTDIFGKASKTVKQQRENTNVCGTRSINQLSRLTRLGVTNHKPDSAYGGNGATASAITMNTGQVLTDDWKSEDEFEYITPEEKGTQCPVCEKTFPKKKIEEHAAECGLEEDKPADNLRIKVRGSSARSIIPRAEAGIGDAKCIPEEHSSNVMEKRFSCNHCQRDFTDENKFQEHKWSCPSNDIVGDLFPDLDDEGQDPTDSTAGGTAVEASTSGGISKTQTKSGKQPVRQKNLLTDPIVPEMKGHVKGSATLAKQKGKSGSSLNFFIR